MCLAMECPWLIAPLKVVVTALMMWPKYPLSAGLPQTLPLDVMCPYENLAGYKLQSRAKVQIYWQGAKCSPLYLKPFAAKEIGSEGINSVPTAGEGQAGNASLSGSGCPAAPSHSSSLAGVQWGHTGTEDTAALGQRSEMPSSCQD